MLRGKKVTLRAMERDDIKQLHELARNVDLVLLSDGAWVPYPMASWEKQFDKHIEDEDQSRFIIEADGKTIGSIGLHPHPGRAARCGTLGIAIHDPEYVGRGYGRDAIETFLDWTFRIMNFRRIKLETLATNERAIRCYEACGFQREGLLREDEYCDGTYRDVVAMGILRREWEQERGAR